jgi:hypothetical protein
VRSLLATCFVAAACLGCHRPFPVKPASACTPEPGAGCLQAGGAPGTLVVQNLAHASLCRVHLRPASGDDWTEPVDETTVIATGFAFDLHVKPGLWDVKLSDCSGAVLAQRLRVPLSDAGAVLTLPAD